MVKNFAILNSENEEIILSIKKYFKDDIEIVSINDDLEGYDYLFLMGFDAEFKEIQFKGKVINLHPSLLPAFACPEAMKESFLSGVKVSGITIHEVTAEQFFGKIIAQYPVLIGIGTHFDEFETEIKTISKKLYPAVIDAVVNDRVFDFSDLFKHSCSGCSGCGKH